jgi:hypothetical protein
MNWKNFGIAVLLGVVVATGLVLAFNRWPQLADSPWTMLGLFAFALVCSRLMRRFIRK